MFGSDHSLNVFIKMEPTESLMYPDLMLSVSTHVKNNHLELFIKEGTPNSESSLKKGDEVKFKAKFVGLGNEIKMHHLHLIEIVPTGERQEIQ